MKVLPEVSLDIYVSTLRFIAVTWLVCAGIQSCACSGGRATRSAVTAAQYNKVIKELQQSLCIIS